jgi:tRNA G18 (ribose-2'-O)-methylase SpoU
MEKDTYENSFNYFAKKIQGKKKEKNDLILAAHELKTPENMGAIIRLAGNLNAAKVYFIHENFVAKESKLKRVAHSSLGKIDYEILNKEEFWERVKDIAVVSLETTKLSTNLYQTNLPKNCVILCGSERFGLPNTMLEKCEQSVFIPMPGSTRSMNVSHALAIAAFEWARQHMPKIMEME